jgi:hypothetical protein
VRVSNALCEQYLMHPIDYRLRDQISANDDHRQREMIQLRTTTPKTS